MSWPAILVLATCSYLFKLGGVLIGNRLGDGPVRHAVWLLPPAMFCGLIALQTFESDGRLVLDARVVGVVVAVVAAWRRLPFIIVIASAVAATAAVRAVAG